MPGVLAELVSPSLFGGTNVVIVRNIQDVGDQVANDIKGYVADPADDVALVLVHRGGLRARGLLDVARKAGAAELSCAEVKKRRDKVTFVQGELRRLRRRATDEAVEALLDAVGGDLRSLAAACGQLVADTSGPIDIEVVRRYHEGHAEVSGFVVADRALDGRCAEALAQLRWALQSGTDPVPIVAALAMGLRGLVKVGSAPRGLSAAALARHVGLPPWKVDAVRRQLRGWNGEGIARALTAVAKADAEVKGAGTDPVYALERAIIEIVRSRG
jgi:DNA polymerase-3 subunit delta